MDTKTRTLPSIVLVPGHWLGAWAWDGVAADLRGRGHHVTAVTLPGLAPDDPHRGSTTLAQHADALRSAVDAAAANGSPVVLVAHSGAGYPTSVLLDRDPTLVARIVYVDSGPAADGSAIDASLPPEQEEVPLPPFDQLRENASLDGISEKDLERFRERAMPSRPDTGRCGAVQQTSPPLSRPRPVTDQPPSTSDSPPRRSRARAHPRA